MANVKNVSFKDEKTIETVSKYASDNAMEFGTYVRWAAVKWGEALKPRQ